MYLTRQTEVKFPSLLRYPIIVIGVSAAARFEYFLIWPTVEDED